MNERTFIAVKPDGVQRRLVGEIVHRFERKGFKLVGLKLVQVLLYYSPSLQTYVCDLCSRHFFDDICPVWRQATEDMLREHYWDLRSKPFFKDLISYMSSGPIVAMVRPEWHDIIHLNTEKYLQTLFSLGFNGLDCED